jgi:hypothetical protein
MISCRRSRRARRRSGRGVGDVGQRQEHGEPQPRRPSSGTATRAARCAASCGQASHPEIRRTDGCGCSGRARRGAGTRTAIPVLRSRAPAGPAVLAGVLLAIAARAARTATSRSTSPRPRGPATTPRPSPARDHDGRHQPPEDLHAVQGRAEPGAAARPPGRRSGRADPLVGAVGERWCFQIGTSALSVSISARVASNASPRWAAAVATTTAMSPIASRPTRCTAATPCTSYSSATRCADLAQPLEGGRVGGVVEAGDALAVVVVAHPADEERQPARRSSPSAASTSATSSGVSRRSTRRTAGRVTAGAH